MTTITCPDCGHLATFDSVMRGADEFCPTCDYPLFWVKSDLPGGMLSDGVDATRRRLPGAGGRAIIGSRPCPACSEQNRLSAINCIRCGSLMDPPPEPEPEPVFEVPAPTPPPPLPPTPEPPLWPLWAAVGAGLAVWVLYLLIIA